MKRYLNRNLAKYITTFQEAYTAIIPYFLLLAFFTLSIAFIQYFNIKSDIINETYLKNFVDVLSLFSSIIIVASISYFFARRFQISTIISLILAIASYVSVIYMENPKNFITVLENYGFSVQALFIPILSTLTLHWAYPRFSLRLPLEDENIHIYRLFDYVLAFAIAYILTFTIYFGIDFVMDRVLEYLNKNFTLDFLPEIFILALRDLLVQLFWFVGIHGEHTVNALFGKDFLFVELFKNLSAGEFNRIFVSIGGAGAGLALLIALLGLTKERLLKTIAKISAPFVIFNINTLLIYAVVVFNRFLFIPFVFLPLINLFLAYIFIKVFNIRFEPVYIVWTTPPFLDAYIKTGGNYLALFLQGILITIDTYIYGIYLQRFFTSQSSDDTVTLLASNLHLPELLRSDQNIEPFLAHREIISSNAKLYRFINRIKSENILIYYQPKIDIKRGICNDFEALIRYREKEKIKGPYFLELFEKAHLAFAIDILVAKEVKKSLQNWKAKGFFPTLNINLHPDTLANPTALKTIINILKGEKVNFEIIERSFLQGREAFEGLEMIQKEGFGISIDDYGTGYTNMETILNYDIKEIKLDRQLILRAHQWKGATVYRSIVKMASDLGLKSVAEGVETKEQFDLAKSFGVDFMQGFYFLPAVDEKKAYEFAKNFKLK